jgi:hypothetical protein
MMRIMRRNHPYHHHSSIGGMHLLLLLDITVHNRSSILLLLLQQRHPPPRANRVHRNGYNNLYYPLPSTICIPVVVVAVGVVHHSSPSYQIGSGRPFLIRDAGFICLCPRNIPRRYNNQDIPIMPSIRS